MAGAILIVVVLLLLPVLMCMGGVVLAGDPRLVGQRPGRGAHEGSELLDLNR